MPKKLTANQVLERVQKRAPEIIGIVEESFTNPERPAIFIDKDYGKFSRLPQTLMKQGCHPQRFKEAQFKKNILSLEEVEQRLVEVHKGIVTIDRSSYKSSSQKAIFVDSEYGSWSSAVYTVIRGHGHPKRAMDNWKISLSEIDSRIRAIHGDTVTMDCSTYSEINKSATFYDKDYGKWITTPKSILRGRGHPLRGYLKAAKNSDNAIIKLHWKTGEELICKAGWEPKVVDYLNSNKIDFLWQPTTFKTNILTPKGKISTYRPDLFLIKENRWVEIKGYFREISKNKWDWLKTQFPTAELWDKKKLKEMGIL